MDSRTLAILAADTHPAETPFAEDQPAGIRMLEPEYPLSGALGPEDIRPEDSYKRVGRRQAGHRRGIPEAGHNLAGTLQKAEAQFVDCLVA